MSSWIKMGVGLRRHPKVVRIASALKADRLRVVGALHAVWCVFDEHSHDGRLEGYTHAILDEEIGWRGFCAALMAVAWLVEEEGEGLSVPDYEEHNGPTAKRRATDASRKGKSRKTSADDPQEVRQLSASDADKIRNREEKKREEKRDTPKPPKGANAVCLTTWLEGIKASGEEAVPESDPVFAYADSVKLPLPFLRLAWLEFRARYGEAGAKKYTDWRRVFRKAIRGNWFKLWWLDPGTGQYALTTVGLQAQRAHEERRAA